MKLFSLTELNEMLPFLRGKFDLTSKTLRAVIGSHMALYSDSPADQLAVLKARMKDMTPEQRLEIINGVGSEWCRHCGGPAGCQCWNDE